MGMPEPCVLFDLDGTLADLSHRLHYIKDGNHDWDSFFAGVGKDVPIPEICDLYQILFSRGKVLIVSGRSDVCRQDTIAWLAHQGLDYDGLYMRSEGDHRPDTVVKQEMLEKIIEDGYDPWLVIDDRQRLARMWRKEGLVCLQCDDWEEREPTKAKGEPTLYIMVGPSGAGKTTWIEDELPYAYRVSSDDIRLSACNGDFRDQTKNPEVFAAAHGMIRSLLLQGIDVVFDATNIKNKDRKAVVALVPEGTRVVYVVVDRRLKDKLITREWRPVALIKRHHNTMKSNLEDILNGDGLDVAVEDARNV